MGGRTINEGLDGAVVVDVDIGLAVALVQDDAADEVLLAGVRRVPGDDRLVFSPGLDGVRQVRVAFAFGARLGYG